MNFFEADIVKTQRQLKELEENPGQQLKSRKLMYLAKIEERKGQLEALRQGKPFLDTEPLAPSLFRSMGFIEVARGEAQHGTSEALDLPPGLDHKALKDQGRAMGLPVDTACGCAWKYAAGVALGSMPLESVMTCEQYHCPSRVLYKFYMVTQWPNQPFYYFSIPPFENDAGLDYMVDQLHGFIEYAESKYPGVIKYDEDKLIECLDRERTALSLNDEIYALCKNKPTPISGDEITTHFKWWARDPKFLRARRDEIVERVAKGVAAVPGEKMRFCWEGNLLNWVDAFGLLAKRQISVPFWFAGSAILKGHLISRPVYHGGRKLTPLEEVAAIQLQHMFGGTGAHYIDNVLKKCREFKVDAIIDMLTRGGTCNLGFKGIIAERAEKELGIPTLALECAKDDPSYITEATVTAKLDEFAQMCLARKGLA